jgi:hypothetical protein
MIDPGVPNSVTVALCRHWHHLAPGILRIQGVENQLQAF